MELEKTKENKMNPIDKRKMLEKEINNYKQSNDNDFLQQKDAYVGLNYALAKAHDYDATKENKYMNKIKEIEEPLRSISQRTEPLKVYLGDLYTVGANLAGLPAISVPVCKTSEGLSISAQLLGKAFDDENVLNGGLVLENLSKE